MISKHTYPPYHRKNFNCFKNNFEIGIEEVSRFSSPFFKKAIQVLEFLILLKQALAVLAVTSRW